MVAIVQLEIEGNLEKVKKQLIEQQTKEQQHLVELERKYIEQVRLKNISSTFIRFQVLNHLCTSNNYPEDNCLAPSGHIF